MKEVRRKRTTGPIEYERQSLINSETDPFEGTGGFTEREHECIVKKETYHFNRDEQT